MDRHFMVECVHMEESLYLAAVQEMAELMQLIKIT
jgi:hypothetical protein